MEITPIQDPSQKSAICNTILRALPQWFGIESAIAAYAAQVADLPFWVAPDANAVPLGFVALAPQTACAAEVCVMGVLSRAHRQGVGRALVEACRDWCRQNGRQYLTVKTLADTHPDPHYAKTRAFYTALGFVPLEVFSQLWGPQNPCLMMIQRMD